jgi:hypothetical protein
MLQENAVRQIAGEEGLGSVTFHDDTLIQAQYQDQLRRSQIDPEKRLMLAILQDAVVCYRRNSGAQLGKRRQLFLEVENWIENQESDYLFSFNNICETLGINPDYLMRGLSTGRDRDVQLEIGHLRLETSSPSIETETALDPERPGLMRTVP